MEKDQLDSLATVAVGSEKMPPAHSHYAASDYSASESPPAYTRPPMKSTAVQITRIIATTLIAISVIIGSFILAAAWLQARASCTPESIAAMRAQSSLQQSQNEFVKHLQPEALIQDRELGKDNLQSLSESSPIASIKEETRPDTKDIKIVPEDDEKSKSDNENGDENDSDDDYDDSDFPPVHIKLPLQLDLDDLAGSLLQQARSIVSCVVERHRSDELMDGENDHEMNSTERQRTQRLRGEHVAVLCESGDPRQEQQEQEMLTPIIVPLGSVQIPLQSQDRGYNSYQVHNQYQAADSQRVPTPVDARAMNAPFPIGILPPELRNIPQVSMEMGPPPRMIPQPHMMRPQQMPMDPMHAMKPTVEQHDQFIREQQQQRHIPITFVHASRVAPMNPHQQHPQGMMPPPPPPSQTAPETQHSITEPRILSVIASPRGEPKHMGGADSQEVPDRLDGAFRGIPIELRRIIQQVPMEINNIIQHITGEARSVQNPIPEGARREQVQEFKPFPENIRPIAVDPFALPIEVRNLLEHGDIEGRAQQNSHEAEEQQQQGKAFPASASQEQSEEPDKRFPVPANVMNIIHEIMEGHAFPIPRFAIPLRPMETMEIPMEAQAQVSPDSQSNDEENQQQPEQQPQHQHASMMMHQEEMQDEANRPHFVQPRSVRSIPEPFAHPREKRVRRRACNCVC